MVLEDYEINRMTYCYSYCYTCEILFFNDVKQCPKCHNAIPSILYKPWQVSNLQPESVRINDRSYSIIGKECGFEFEDVVSQFIGENDIEFYLKGE